MQCDKMDLTLDLVGLNWAVCLVLLVVSKSDKLIYFFSKNDYYFLT